MESENETKGVRLDPQDLLDSVRADPLGEARGGGGSWFERLVRIMDVLRSPGGCPWDLEQEPRTIRPSLLEETYEVLDAIDGEDEVLREELGDLLLQIVFLARMKREEGAFDVQDVARSVAEKLVRRHPHVFGEVDAGTASEVVANWERIKDRERREKGKESLMSGLPASLPALLRAYRIGQKAERVGFDWGQASDLLAETREGIAGLERALNAGAPGAVREQLGSLLFTLVQTARRIGQEPEETLQEANARFLGRFRRLEERMSGEGLDWDSVGEARLEGFWEDAGEA